MRIEYSGIANYASRGGIANSGWHGKAELQIPLSISLYEGIEAELQIPLSGGGITNSAWQGLYEKTEAELQIPPGGVKRNCKFRLAR